MVVNRDERRLKTPARHVVEKQDPGYSQAEFVRDLKRVSERRRELSRRPASRPSRRTA
jgi:hypothetical protein